MLRITRLHTSLHIIVDMPCVLRHRWSGHIWTGLVDLRRKIWQSDTIYHL
jgi:hypothetical protein